MASFATTTPAFVTGGHTVLNKGAAPIATSTCRRTRPGEITMGKNARFGPFTPAVVAARLIVGEKQLNKIRGQAIKSHSQAISKFCEYVGASAKTKQGLIRTAKENGSVLGFLS